MKNMSAETIYREISRLPSNEKIILLYKLISEISHSIKGNGRANIYDIRGVGKKIWEGMDAQEYVNRERASWE